MQLYSVPGRASAVLRNANGTSDSFLKDWMAERCTIAHSIAGLPAGENNHHNYSPAPSSSCRLRTKDRTSSEHNFILKAWHARQGLKEIETSTSTTVHSLFCFNCLSVRSKVYSNTSHTKVSPHFESSFVRLPDQSSAEPQALKAITAL